MCFVLNGCPKEQHILVNWTADRPDLCTKSTKFPLGDNWKSAVPIRNVRSVIQAFAYLSKTLGRRVLRAWLFSTYRQSVSQPVAGREPPNEWSICSGLPKIKSCLP